jgi:hypothetical protein
MIHIYKFVSKLGNIVNALQHLTDDDITGVWGGGTHINVVFLEHSSLKWKSYHAKEFKRSIHISA